MALTEFLTARLDEDEQFAVDAVHYAYVSPDIPQDHTWRWSHAYKPKSRKHGWSSSLHDGAPSPERVLAEVAAKRELVEEYERARVHYDTHRGPHGGGLVHGLGIALRAFASVHAAHPDFDPAWA